MFHILDGFFISGHSSMIGCLVSSLGTALSVMESLTAWIQVAWTFSSLLKCHSGKSADEWTYQSVNWSRSIRDSLCAIFMRKWRLPMWQPGVRYSFVWVIYNVWCLTANYMGMLKIHVTVNIILVKIHWLTDLNWDSHDKKNICYSLLKDVNPQSNKKYENKYPTL